MKKFWNGAFAYMAVTSLIQDWYGKEGYMKAVDEHWIDASITVPIALIILALAIWDYFD